MGALNPDSKGGRGPDTALVLDGDNHQILLGLAVPCRCGILAHGYRLTAFDDLAKGFVGLADPRRQAAGVIRWGVGGQNL